MATGPFSVGCLVALDVLDTVTKALDTFETLERHVTFPEKEKSGRVRIRGSLRRIIYDRSRSRELSRDVSFCVQLQ